MTQRELTVWQADAAIVPQAWSGYSERAVADVSTTYVSYDPEVTHCLTG